MLINFNKKKQVKKIFQNNKINFMLIKIFKNYD